MPLQRPTALLVRKPRTVRTAKRDKSRAPSAMAQATPDGPEGRWILAGGNAPGFVAAARCAPAGAMERRIASPALSTGGGERLPCRAPFPPVDNAAGCATLGCGSGTLPGCLASMGCFRGYRCAQPPANFQQPCRADRGVVAAFGRKPPSCLPVRVEKLAAVCRHAATPALPACYATLIRLGRTIPQH